MAPIAKPINFLETVLSHYDGFYATVLDDVFTAEECRELLASATASAEWVPAGLSAEAQTQTVHSNFRNSDRILLFNATEASQKIYNKLRPLVEEDLGEIPVGGKWDGVTGKQGRKQGPTWKLVGVNPRLSFLRYGPGHYFKQHCDGLVDIPQDDGKIIKTFVTLHLYLNGEHEEDPPLEPKVVNLKLSEDDPDEPLVGGATRFWTPNKKHFLDVFPRRGRVLVFQQRMLVHSGEEVIQGVKYTMRSDFMFEQVV